MTKNLEEKARRNFTQLIFLAYRRGYARGKDMAVEIKGRLTEQRNSCKITAKQQRFIDAADEIIKKSDKRIEYFMRRDLDD